LSKIVELEKKKFFSGTRRNRAGKIAPSVKRQMVIVLLVGFLMTSFSSYLVYALFDIQYNQHEHYAKLASEQHWQQIVDKPDRGDILDRNGNLLASTTYVYTVGVTPKDVKSISQKSLSKEEIGENIAEILGMDIVSVYEALSREKETYVQLIKGVEKETADVLLAYLRKNSIGGVKLDDVAKRYYLYDSLASQIIGYANPVDGLLIGQLGIEAKYNNELTGTAGYTYSEVASVSRNVLPYSAPTSVAAQDGYNLILNIDKTIQEIVEREIKTGYEVFEVQESVTAIVVNPYTGAVLANANYPNFNLNAPTAKPDFISDEKWDAMEEREQLDLIMSKAWRNHAISNAVEPGSTFKTLTTAMALEEATTAEHWMYSDERQEYGLGEEDYIACWMENAGMGNHGSESLRDAFANSCNPVFVQLAKSIGRDKFYGYVGNFGFLQPTGIDLPAEGTGIIYPYGQEKPFDVDMYALSIGESATVTPMQLIMAYAAVANGGDLMVPQIVKALTDKDGNIVKEFEPEVKRSIFSEQTAKRVRDLMTGVVQEGTGKAASIPGYSVAGKTGTATFEMGEDEGLHVLSFGGYAPSENPEVVVLVIVDRPADEELGSSGASAIAARIIEHSLSYLREPREYKNDDMQKMVAEIEIPESVLGMPYKEAKTLLYEKGFIVVDGEDTRSENALVSGVYPPAGSHLYKNGKIVLYTSGDIVPKETVIPDFSGKNISEILSEAYNSEVNVLIEGNINGVAVSQRKEIPDTPADKNTSQNTPDMEDTPDAENNGNQNSEASPEGSDNPSSETDIEEDEVPNEVVKENKRGHVGTVIRVTME